MRSKKRAHHLYNFENWFWPSPEMCFHPKTRASKSTTDRLSPRRSGVIYTSDWFTGSLLKRIENVRRTLEHVDQFEAQITFTSPWRSTVWIAAERQRYRHSILIFEYRTSTPDWIFLRSSSPVHSLNPVTFVSRLGVTLSLRAHRDRVNPKIRVDDLFNNFFNFYSNRLRKNNRKI